MSGRRFALSFLACFVCTAIAPRASFGSGELVERLDEIQSSHAGLCATAGRQGPLQTTVQRLATQVRPSIASATEPKQAVDALNRFLIAGTGIKSSQDLHDPCNLLLGAVLERKQGYCVGVASLYLVLARELDLPLFAVATPSHVFLRYDDGTTRINIDTTLLGVSKSDDLYAREGRIPDKSIRKGVFLRNLSEDEFLAQVYNNLGVIYSERKDFTAAAREYKMALDLDRRLPAAWYNWGNDLLKTGVEADATRAFTRSLALFPGDVWALNNRGISYKMRGKVMSARRDFEAALLIDPGFEQARTNLDALSAAAP